MFACPRAGPTDPMSAEEAAEAILPTLARPLQRYLRVTRQQPRYTMTNVLDHLTLCISNDMSHKAFLSRYLTQVVGHTSFLATSLR